MSESVYYSVGCDCDVLTCVICVFFFQAEDGIRDLVRSRGLGDVYKRQVVHRGAGELGIDPVTGQRVELGEGGQERGGIGGGCLLYTSDAADERSSVDLGGRRIIKKKKNVDAGERDSQGHNNSTRSESEVE